MHTPSHIIPLTRPAFDTMEEAAILQVLRSSALAGDGTYCRRVEAVLREMCGVEHALLTTSCSHALELAMLTLDLQPGDEVILPSFTFTATANAIALRGATPVFVEIDPGTWNIDPNAVELALTSRTRGILPVHYAGQGCDMHALQAIADRHNLWIVEDAAQGMGAYFDGKHLGGLSALGCLSFHNTKNIVSGEGGALLTDDPTLARKAEIMREKGTNRAAFFRGEVDKYTWVDVGSSYVLSDLLAALLETQLHKTEAITRARIERWERYQAAFGPLAAAGLVQLPVVHPLAQINSHLYGFLVNPQMRDAVLHQLRTNNVGATFHYVPLHSAPAAMRFGPQPQLPITDRVSESLVRLPLFPDLTADEQDYIIAKVYEAFSDIYGTIPYRALPQRTPVPGDALLNAA